MTENDIDLIVPSFEEGFYLAARRADLAPRVEVFTGPFEALAVLHDKVSFQKLCEDAGVPIPETLVATDQKTLRAAIEKFPQYFARAAFSRGGVALLTNTGPLAGATKVEDCEPTPERPWIIQPFVSGPMVCTYATVVDGRVTSMVTHTSEQWAPSTGIAFVADDSTKALEHTQSLEALDPDYSGQPSLDFVDHGGELVATECNPRATDGTLMPEAQDLSDAIQRQNEELVVSVPGTQREIKAAVLANAFTPHLKTIPKTLRDLLRGNDIGKGWHDSFATMWALASLVRDTKLGRGKHQRVLEALGEKMVWNGGPIEGMTSEDAATLEAVHARRPGDVPTSDHKTMKTAQ